MHLINLHFWTYLKNGGIVITETRQESQRKKNFLGHFSHIVLRSRLYNFGLLHACKCNINLIYSGPVLSYTNTKLSYGLQAQLKATVYLSLQQRTEEQKKF